MNLERVFERIREVIELGSSLELDRDLEIAPGQEDAMAEWAMSGCNVLRVAVGERSHYYEQFRGYSDGLLNTYNMAAIYSGNGVLKAALTDLERGLATSIAELVTAGVFDDLVDMAAHLHEKGYHLPAVSITGAVLEDSLRKLCEKHQIEWEGESSISKLNDLLWKKQVYSKPQWRQVQVWGDLRNDVDHGNFSDPADIDPNAVQLMMQGVRDFIIKYST